MAESELLRLTRIEVSGLFGMYDHKIALNLEDRVTLLHGPNGVGKTTMLEMVSALLDGNFSYLARVPMHSFTMNFNDDSTLRVLINGSAGQGEDTHEITLIRDGDSMSTGFSSRLDFERATDKYNNFWPSDLNEGHWVNELGGEILTESEVIRRYGGKDDEEDISSPDWLENFLDRVGVYFIRVQRLIQPSPERRPHHHRYWRSLPPISRVIECRDDFNHNLASTMAWYGRHAQALDQSFPQRLLSAGKTLPQADLQEKMEAVASKTNDLQKMGILDQTSPFDIPQLDSHGDNTHAKVMTLYVEDTEEKLKALDHFADRARIFLENVNQKFRHKKIQIDREVGFVVEDDRGQPLQLSSLSSGEQHELVLHYGLLFSVPSNTVVLIDEPELSLHVTWQKKFLPDLLEILKLRQFDALIATHSPYIVGERDDLMVPLSDSV
ncbi:MAG: AAA family ATPase [Aestuariivita sp.]|nr:AAA family ATPase [Aestuariivita sp.]MCY4201735.1 AAA family ATPase [Aestuariivita sp.]